MDFIVDFLKAVFVEKDKNKIKDSVVTIAVVIIALWMVNSYNKIGDGIESNSKKIDKISNYKIIVVSVSDSIFTVKSATIKENTKEEIEGVIGLIYSLDRKRRQEIDYLIKYKDKSYQELMDILNLNEKRWEYNVNKNKVMEDELLKLISPVIIPIKETGIIEPRSITSMDTTPSTKKTKKRNFFTRLFKSKDD